MEEAADMAEVEVVVMAEVDTEVVVGTVEVEDTAAEMEEDTEVVVGTLVEVEDTAAEVEVDTGVVVGTAVEDTVVEVAGTAAEVEDTAAEVVVMAEVGVMVIFFLLKLIYLTHLLILISHTRSKYKL